MALKGNECQERIQREADKIRENIWERCLDFSVLGSRGNQVWVMKSGDLHSRYYSYILDITVALMKLEEITYKNTQVE